MRTVAERHHIPVHMDGSRLLNAAVGLNVPVKQLAKDVESVSFCLSKVDFTIFYMQTTWSLPKFELLAL